MTYSASILHAGNAKNKLAAADLSDKTKYFVKRVADNKVNLAGAGEAALGVLWNDPRSGDMAWVVSGGSPDVYSGAAVTVGAEVAVDADGKAVTATSGDVVVGIAVDATTAADQLLQIDFLGEASYTKA